MIAFLRTVGHRAMGTLAATALGLALLGAYGSAWADRRAALGSYERQALDQALAAHNLLVEQTPEGKIVRAIHVVNLDVFAPGESILTWFNVFHRVTREDIIEREVLLRPGQPWDEETATESARRLRDPLFSTLAVVMPVQTPDPGQVDLLVVTRDLWSLRLNTIYELQNGTLSRLIVAPSENNLLGWRKQLAAIFDLDLGTYAVGPLYVDKNVAGTSVQLKTDSALIFSRADSEFEGVNSNVSLSYPLLSLKQKWGADLVVSHFDAVVRSFQGTDLRTYDNPDTMDVIEEVPYRYDRRITKIDSSVTRALGTRIKHHVSVGHELNISRPEVPAALAPSSGLPDARACEMRPYPDLATAFACDVLPRSERSSALTAGYRLFTPRYTIYRNIATFDLPEELQLGPDLRTELAVAQKLIGAEQSFVRLTGSLAWTLGLGNGFATALAGASVRLQDGELIDNLVEAEVKIASPILGHALRLHGRAGVSAYIDDTQNRFFALGGDTGLRGYPIGEFAGDKLVRVNVEARTLPVRIWFSRTGLLAFWDMGHAADGFDSLAMQHDVGVGLRVLLPQLQQTVFRLDWAVPLTGELAGLPGRIIAGAEQIF